MKTGREKLTRARWELIKKLIITEGFVVVYGIILTAVEMKFVYLRARSMMS